MNQVKMLARKNSSWVKTMLCIVFTFLLTAYCSRNKYRQSEKPTGIYIAVQYPIRYFMVDGKPTVFNWIDTLYIHYYQNAVVYGISMQDMQTGKGIYNAEYFFCKKDSVFGWFTKSPVTDGSKWQRLRADSFLQNKLYKTDKFDLNNEELPLITRIKDDKNNSVIEKYHFLHKYNEAIPDSLYCYFSNDPFYKSIDYAFSKKLDSTKAMKLIKYRLLYNEGFSKQLNMDLPKHEYSAEIKECSNPTPKEVLSIFEKFKDR